MNEQHIGKNEMLFWSCPFCVQLPMWSTRRIKSRMSRAPSPPLSPFSPTRRAVIRMWPALPAYHPPTSPWLPWRDARPLSFWTGRNPTMRPEVQYTQRKGLISLESDRRARGSFSVTVLGPCCTSFQILWNSQLINNWLSWITNLTTNYFELCF